MTRLALALSAMTDPERDHWGGGDGNDGQGGEGWGNGELMPTDGDGFSDGGWVINHDEGYSAPPPEAHP